MTLPKKQEGFLGWLTNSPPTSPANTTVAKSTTKAIIINNENCDDDRDNEEEELDYYHSIQHPSHIPTPKTIHYDDTTNDDDVDNIDDLIGSQNIYHAQRRRQQNQQRSNNNNNKGKNWLTDDIIPGVGGAIVGGVSKLTSFLHDGSNHQHHQQQQRPISPSTASTSSSSSSDSSSISGRNNIGSDKNTHNNSNDNQADERRIDIEDSMHSHDSSTHHRDSLGVEYWGNKRQQMLLLQHASFPSLDACHSSSSSNYEHDDDDDGGDDNDNCRDDTVDTDVVPNKSTDVVDTNGDDNVRSEIPRTPSPPTSPKGRARDSDSHPFHDSNPYDRNLVPRQDSSIAWSSSSSSSSIGPCQQQVSLVASPATTQSRVETSLQRKWVIENAFNLHSSRASQRILDDDELVNLSLLTEDDNDDDNDDQSIVEEEEEEEVKDNNNNDVENVDPTSPSKFWYVYDTMEEASLTTNIQPRKHKGRFTGCGPQRQ